MQKFTLVAFLIFVAAVGAAPFSSNEFITQTHELITPDDLDTYKAEVFKEISGRISNGLPARDDQFPFVGDVTVRWRDGRSTGCTASLIAANWVLTARRCIVNDITNDVGVTMMAVFGSASRTAQRTTAVGVFATWRNGVGGNPNPDIALFRLNVPLTLSATIQLPTMLQRDEVFQRTLVTIPGWGAIDIAGTPATTLQFAEFINTTPFECTPDLVLGVTIYHFCSEPVVASPAMLRDGDFGAPVILYENGPQMPPTLIGVASTTAISLVNFADIIAVTQIGQFLDFIHETTGIPWRF